MKMVCEYTHPTGFAWLRRVKTDLSRRFAGNQGATTRE